MFAVAARVLTSCFPPEHRLVIYEEWVPHDNSCPHAVDVDVERRTKSVSCVYDRGAQPGTMRRMRHCVHHCVFQLRHCVALLDQAFCAVRDTNESTRVPISTICTIAPCGTVSFNWKTLDMYSISDNYLASLKLEETNENDLEYAKQESEEDAKAVEALDPEINCNESTDGLNDSATGDSAFKWPYEAILLLIEEYIKHQSNFYNGKISRKKLWEKISARLQAQSHSVTGPQCQSKFARIKKAYENIKDHNNKSGDSAKAWPYFVLIKDFLGDKPFGVPVAACSSTGKRVRTNSECSADGSCTEQDVPSKKNKLAPMDKMLEALEERAQKDEESKERRFNQLLAFKEQKAREDLQLKTRALDLLEKILNSENKL